jgi:hypothetical protein
MTTRRFPTQLLSTESSGRFLPTGKNREQLAGRILGNQLTFASSEMTWAVRVDGNAITFNGPGAPNKIEGKVDEAARHTALIMTAAFSLDMSITTR